MKGIIAESRFACLAINAATGATGSDLILNEVDCGGAENGTLVIVLQNTASSDVANLEVWTSMASDFSNSSGTQLSTVTSDGTRIVLIASDANDGNAYMQGVLNAAMSDLTITTGTVSNMYEDGMYVFDCPNVARYLNVQYDSDGTGSTISAVFIGRNLAEVPWTSERSAY